MCKAFSVVVSSKGKVFWKAGVDSHDRLFEEFKLNESPHGDLRFARIEIVPDNKEKYPYLYPDLPWKLLVDERVRPAWLTPIDEQLAWDAHAEWEKIIYQFKYQEAVNPIHPLKIGKHKPSKQDILNLQKWASVGDSVRASVWDSVRASVWDSVGASVRDSVGDSVWDSVRASVWDSVWDSVRASVWDSVWASVGDSVWASVWASVWDSVRDSVWAYISGMFPNIKEWKYAEKLGEHPYEPAVDLWKRGFVPSFDGSTWRLHSGKNAAIVFEITKTELAKVK